MRKNDSGQGIKVAMASENHPGNGPAFYAKWQVATISQNRHCKNMPTIHIGDTVTPLCQAVIVPHFPEKSANYRCDCRNDQRSPVACGKRAENRSLAEKRLNAADQYQRCDPDKSKKLIRENTQKPKDDGCQDQHNNGRETTFREIDLQAVIGRQAKNRKRYQEQAGTDDSRQNRCESQGCENQVFYGRKYFDSLVVPIAYKTIHKLEKPPENRADKKKNPETFGTQGKPRQRTSLLTPCIDKKNISCPWQAEGMALNGAEPWIPAPGKPPA